MFLSVCTEHLAAMVTGAGQVAGAVAVARKVVRVEACHLKKKKKANALF